MIIERAMAKVNLALHVLGRRADGYHLLDSVVGFADVADEIHIAEAAQDAFNVTGPFADGVPRDGSNLVLKAVAAVRAHIVLPPLSITLEKNLPIAGGIGGGSSDAAATLRALQTITGQNIASPVLHKIALQLGADVPVCLVQRISRMEGIGEILSPLKLPPSPAIVLVNPNVECLTAQVFGELGLAKGQNFRDAVSLHTTATWRNDLSEPALRVQPIIADVLAALNKAGKCNTVRMSGSGATCFGLVENIAIAKDTAKQIARDHPTWWAVGAQLL